ncbi:MAG: LysR substrate-binding domain-containing protein [Methylobacterium sp.]
MRYTQLDMDALRGFAAGIDAGSFAKAAERLGRSTSAISAQLKKLEDQAGTALVRRSGRGLALTESGETLLSYARKLLSLNDEAVGALHGHELEGWVRLGLQEDFGEMLLPQVLGRFKRAHPKVRIECRIDRRSELVDRIESGQLDLALTWDDGSHPSAERIAMIPLCWLGPVGASIWRPDDNEPLPLATLEAPCLLRTIACAELDRRGIAWRVALVSPSLAGIWAAVSAGLGVALRTPINCHPAIEALDPASHGLPVLPSLSLVLHRRETHAQPLADHLTVLMRQTLRETLPKGWLSDAGGASHRAG